MDSEADRIRTEYARRDREIPGDRYLAFARPELYMRQARERAAADGLRSTGLLPADGRRVLEVGCGNAPWLAILENWGAGREDLAGIDLREDEVNKARRRFPGADLRVGNAARLPWKDSSFDLVVQSTVFSSILDADMRTDVAREMARMVRVGGAVLWFDFFRDNPRNRQVKGIRRTELERLFPNFSIDLQRVILAPPLSRALLRGSWTAVYMLESVRLLNTHYVAVLQPPAEVGPAICGGEALRPLR